jgi:hypothetical protein
MRRRERCGGGEGRAPAGVRFHSELDVFDVGDRGKLNQQTVRNWL